MAVGKPWFGPMLGVWWFDVFHGRESITIGEARTRTPPIAAHNSSHKRTRRASAELLATWRGSRVPVRPLDVLPRAPAECRKFANSALALLSALVWDAVQHKPRPRSRTQCLPHEWCAAAPCSRVWAMVLHPLARWYGSPRGWPKSSLPRRRLLKASWPGIGAAFPAQLPSVSFWTSGQLAGGPKPLLSSGGLPAQQLGTNSICVPRSPAQGCTSPHCPPIHSPAAMPTRSASLCSRI